MGKRLKGIEFKNSHYEKEILKLEHVDKLIYNMTTKT